MATKNRLMLIREQVKNEKKVVVADLSRIYKVTEETIRRDLEKLEAEGVVTRTFGGAVLNKASSTENVHFYKRADINIEEKKVIAANSIEILNDKTTIVSDSSTTVMEAIKLLKNRKNLTVLTVSTETSIELADTDIQVILTGGILNKKTLSLEGQVAKDTISRYHVDMALISCKGLDMIKGAMDTNENETEVKKCMIKQASEVALLVDHTKFNRTVFVQLIDLENIDYLVTDRKPDEEWISLCEEKGIKLIY